MTCDERMQHHMRQSPSHYAPLLLALGAGACHGKLTVLNDPNLDSPTDVDAAPSADVGASSISNSNAPRGKCSRLRRDRAAYRDSALPPPPLQCGVCDCEESDSTCEEQACQPPFVLP